MLGSKSCSVDQTLIFKTISYLLFANYNKTFISINNEIYYCCIEGVLKAVENVNKVIGPALIEKVQVNHVHIVLLIYNQIIINVWGIELLELMLSGMHVM